MKIKVQICQCKQCKYAKIERQVMRKKWIRSFRRRSKQFTRWFWKDPIDNLKTLQYTD